MQSTPCTSTSGDSPTAPRELPWAILERNLVIWLAALQTSATAGDARKVLGLLEGLVLFISSNEAVFLHAMTASESPEDGLKRMGAPDTFISTFMEVIRIAGGLHGPRIITFGNSPALTPHLAAEVLRRFRAAASRSGSPRTASPRPPHLVPRTTNEMLEAITSAAATTSNATAAISTELLGLSSQVLQLSKVSDAVAVHVQSLPPAVISALEQARAAPFLFFRWISSCLIEVLFCIYHPDTIMIVKRKIVYVGPKPGSQLDGPLMLPSSEEPIMLEGPYCLPWMEVAGMLEAPPVDTQ